MEKNERVGQGGKEKVVSEGREGKPKCSLCTPDTLFSEESVCGFEDRDVRGDVIALRSSSLVQNDVT